MFCVKHVTSAVRLAMVSSYLVTLLCLNHLALCQTLLYLSHSALSQSLSSISNFLLYLSPLALSLSLYFISVIVLYLNHSALSQSPLFYVSSEPNRNLAAGVRGMGAAAELRLQDCTMHNCKQSGILFSKEITFLVEGCTSRENVMDGISVTKGASGTLRGNTCRDNQRHGICIIEREGDVQGSVVVEGNPLRCNRKESLHITGCRDRVKQANNLT